MRRAFVVPLVILFAACGSSGPVSQPTAQPGHGAISIHVVPNPIVAQHVSGNDYDFPFDVIVEETGGRTVMINRVTADVMALGLHLASETYDAARINSLGFSTTVAANSTTRYHFGARRTVTDERLFSGVSTQIRVDATDDTGSTTTAQTIVKVTK